jgi:Eukaryotic aspartyl protease
MGHNLNRIVGDVNYVPITGTSRASKYWGIDQSITYGSSGQIILNLSAGIVDTGTTLILIATGSILPIIPQKHCSQR